MDTSLAWRLRVLPSPVGGTPARWLVTLGVVLVIARDSARDDLRQRDPVARDLKRLLGFADRVFFAMLTRAPDDGVLVRAGSPLICYSLPGFLVVGGNAENRATMAVMLSCPPRSFA